MFVRVLVLSAFLLSVTGCASRVPSPTDFTQAAVGTLMESGHEESIKPNLAADQSGALVVNQNGYRIQVAVNNTITEIPPAHDFLFSLAPGKYDFYIFEPDRAPYVHTETLEGGKLRYLYISRVGQPGG